MAMWDIMGKVAKRPIRQLLGDTTRRFLHILPVATMKREKDSSSFKLR
jgi:L-alanine-DL-glutamate epimerase-like enolase superfamily enzyme